MTNRLFHFYSRFTDGLWRQDLREMERTKRWVILPVRMLVVVLRQLLGGQLNLRAMSLVYTTLLSTVPLLAVSFSVLKGFGVHNQLEPILANVLAPLGPRGAEISSNVIGFVENIKAGVLGSLGLVFLLYTVVSLTQKIESSFNYVWQVDRLRGMAQRFSSYLSVILIGPVLMFAAVGLTATITSHSAVQSLMGVEPIGRILVLTGKLIPYLLVIVTFSFIYLFIPNTRVKMVPALVGGVVAGVLWQTSGWIFAAFVATSPNYAAIYSGFAILVLLLIWLYLSWLILLLGAQVAFYVQYPQYLTREPVKLQLSNRLQERLALQVMYMVAAHHFNNREPWTLDALVQYLGLPMQPVHKVLRLMLESGFLSETCDDEPAYLPRRDIDTILVSQLYDAVRSAGENRLLTISTLPGESHVEQLLVAVNTAAHEAMGDRTLKDLVGDKSLTSG
ncbi:membrane protein [Thiogranum longum]|uniref:Membrane protein n=1 Tax=Thiogranum longum TaxID=1537524 RepID=A0A4R1HCK7_9GAMM|nr:YihY/virulence factor BrkB family protein [Thiogranum longum]TCK19188.1 membrane protein [Thiogranum longum]